MREKPHDTAEKGRVNDGLSPRGETYGNFLLRHPGGAVLVAVVGDAKDWPFVAPAFEHVSVSVRGEDLFFGPEENVIQYHPPRAEYVDVHEFVLHLWKPVGVDIPPPPRACV